MSLKVKTRKSWISTVLLSRMIIVFLLLVAACFIFSESIILLSIFETLSIVMGLIVLYFFYAKHQLSAKGEDLQQQISALVIDKIDKNASGKLLDIGCGSGILSVELAMKCPLISIYGVDYWRGMWGYSKEECEKLARSYEVAERITFERCSAASLPFEDESFDFVISNMVFHEVADAQDKREVIKEALRVLKKNGLFVFQDLFLSKKLYGKSEELLHYLNELGINEIQMEDTVQLIKVPALLKNKMFFGNTALLYGKR